MRKSYFITALAVCLALVTAQAQEAVVGSPDKPWG